MNAFCSFCAVSHVSPCDVTLQAVQILSLKEKLNGCGTALTVFPVGELVQNATARVTTNFLLA